MASSPNNSDGVPLTEKRRIAIANHLNQDHLEDMLACVKAQEGADWVEQVRIISLDTAGINLEVSGSERVHPLRLDFPVPVMGVLAFKRTLGTMITESRAQLGWDAPNPDM
ncbi:MAG: DUF2470 domain-containing protein [Cyanobacteria bacterium P01_D01_bin.56]